MTVNTLHPKYTEKLEQWEMTRDAYAGEETVKGSGTAYLPATTSMKEDGLNPGQDGYTAYTAYVERAIFPDYLADAVAALLGVMHKKPARFKVPARMEPVLKRLTADGRPADALLRHINEQQLLYGRVGLLAEVPTGLGPTATPFVATYDAFSIINWDDGADGQGARRLELVVLNESGPRRMSGFEWEDDEQYRILSVSDAVATASNEDQDPIAAGTYVVAVLDTADPPAPEAFIAPSLAGKTLDRIPFVVAGSRDIVYDPDVLPLIGLTRDCFAIYRGEADYRQNLFMQGQETFVTIGAEDTFGGGNVRTGSGMRVDVPLGGDAKYVGVSAAGLSEQRQALVAQHQAAAEKGAKLLSQPGNPQQSGDALRIRVAAQAASLTSIALAGAMALQEVLRIMATWMGLNPDDVEVEPNLEFADIRMTGDELMKLMQAKKLGAPLSDETIHDLMKKGGMTKMEFAVEKSTAEDELDALVAADAAALGMDPNNNNDPGDGGDQPNPDPSQDPNPQE